MEENRCVGTVKRTSPKLMLTVIAVGLGTVLFNFPPDQYGFYPRCPIYTYTHLLCPGCGATRAMYELLHFNVTRALHYNALLTVLAPAGILWFAFSWWQAVRESSSLQLRVPRLAVAGVILLAVLFTVARNTGIAFVI